MYCKIGKENGFYKSPLPNFDILLELALKSKSRDDMYGAAAMILENFADELLCQCETLINDRSRKKELVLVNPSEIWHFAEASNSS